MIEGAYALPWFQDGVRRKSLGIDDCKRCMATQGKLQRQALGCGFEPRGNASSVWQPPDGGSSQRGYRGPALTVCAGYTANLPEVTEAAIARVHWKVGSIVPACDGEMPTEALLNTILVLDNSSSHLEGWLMTPSADGGGGK